MTTQFYSERTKQHLASKSRSVKIKNTLFAIVVSLIAVSPVVGTLIILMNEL